jgi:hypothetical protein
MRSQNSLVAITLEPLVSGWTIPLNEETVNRYYKPYLYLLHFILHLQSHVL